MSDDPRVTLWRLSWTHSLGVVWLAMRTCDPAQAEAWRDVFAKDDAQGTVFAIAAKRPPLPENAQALARHPAVWN